MKAIKRDSVLRCILECLLLFFLGLPFAIVGAGFLLQPEEQPVALSEVDFTEDVSGMYVTGTIYGVYGSYAEIIENDVVKQYEYLTDAGADAFMGLRIETADKEMVDSLLEALNSYSLGLGTEELILENAFEVTGTIRKMETEMIELQHQAVGWDFLSEEEQVMILPYYLEVGENSSNKIGGVISFLIGAALILLGVFFIISMIRNGNELFENYIQNSQDPECAKQKLEDFLKNVTPNVELVYNDEFVFGRNGSKIAFAETLKIVWIYMKEFTQKTNFVVTDRTFTVVLGTIDGNKMEIKVSDLESANKYTKILAELCPHAIAGFSDELERLYTNNLKDFLNLKYYSDTNVMEEDNKVENRKQSFVGATIAGDYKITDFLADYDYYSYYGGYDKNGRPVVMTAIENKEEEAIMAQKEWILYAAEMQSQLDHPGIQKVIEVINTPHYCMIFKDAMQGFDLLTILQKNGPIPEKTVVDWGIQICDILQYLHTMNPPRIHRDVKPSNFVFRVDNTICLIEFSLMRYYNPNLNADEQNLGTKGYAAPEQFGGRGQTDPRTDIYGLGMTMHHLLTGIAPYNEPYEVRPICEINSQLSTELESIITKCIATEPKDRYQNCLELMNDLKELKNS